MGMWVINKPPDSYSVDLFPNKINTIIDNVRYTTKELSAFWELQIYIEYRGIRNKLYKIDSKWSYNG